LKEIIHEALDRKKPLLGICYGHQFIVRTLSGKERVRKALTPEFGWGEIRLTGDGERNPLFEGVARPVCMLSHYDEAYNLDDDYRVLAYTPQCSVHAFQYKNLPVWGVQFHPEYDIHEADEIFEFVAKDDPSYMKYFINDIKNENRSQNENERIIENFLLTT
jgi:GMP synthase (glutamine-hydrolysing)